MRPIPKLMSKTKIMTGFRCAKAIYLTVHQPDLVPKPNEELQAKFDQGNEVGKAARERFSGGTLVENPPWDFVGALKRTRELIAQGCETIFEGAFEYKGLFARVDILQFSPATKRWKMIEVKSATKVKPEYLDDVGFQTYVVANSPLPLEQICIWHIDSECRFPNLSNLFSEVDVTEELRQRHPTLAPRLTKVYEALRSPEIPQVDLGPQCFTASECVFYSRCREEKGVPDVSIFNLPGLREKVWQHYAQGRLKIEDLHDLAELDELQRRIVESHRRGEKFLAREPLAAAVGEWKYPLVFLDFETINPAIPRYPGTRPYQQVPFQFSAHVLREPGAALEHHEFLHLGPGDPREALIPELLKACTGEGAIVAYYAKFESAVIQELADFSPSHRASLEALLPRMRDPLPLIREHVYYPAFAGSFSLKKVAPALLGAAHDYSHLPVGDGGAAQRAFDKIYKGVLSDSEAAATRAAMLDYCRRDTLAMVELFNWMNAPEPSEQNP